MRKWIIGAVVLVIIGVIAFLALGQGEGGLGGAEPTPVPELPPVTASDSVVAEAEVVPVQDVELRFEISGTVEDILVSEGQDVNEGETLAMLDADDLQLTVEDAEAQLARANADLEKLLSGASDDEVDVQRAQIANAEATLAEAEATRQRRDADVAQQEAHVAQRQAEVARVQGELQRVQGQVTQADIVEAEANLEAARASLADLEDGPDTVDVQTAQAAVAQRRAALEEARNQLSANKTNAQLAVEVAANDLRNAQAEYSSVYWEIREIERELRTVEQEIWQDLKDREERALRAVADAEAALNQAQVDLQTAQQSEVTGIQEAEANLADAQARLNDVLEGAEADELATARAEVARAQAALASLTGAERAGALASASASVSSAQANVQAAQASVDAAQADIASAEAVIDSRRADVERQQSQLEDLTAPPRDFEVDDLEAQILQREVSLRRAELELEKAALVSPIVGTVVEIDLTVGERVDTSLVAIRVADFSEWEIETTDLTELGVVRINVGDPATVTFDALPDLTINGTVSSIQDIGKNRQGDIVYKVTIAPDEWDERLRWGMTATVEIESSNSSASDSGAQESNTTE